MEKFIFASLRGWGWQKYSFHSPRVNTAALAACSKKYLPIPDTLHDLQSKLEWYTCYNRSLGMCILEIERTLNNVVACLALPGSYPNPKTAGPRPSFPSNAHACTITRLTSIFYAMIFRTSVKTFASISYTKFLTRLTTIIYAIIFTGSEYAILLP